MTAGLNPPQHDHNSADERLREIEQQLKEKESAFQERDRTVRELTARLSQTAERLDRVQRVGPDQTVIRTTTFPVEVVERQTELVDDLKRAVQMWEEMQTASGLGRLESQLSDLQSLFDEHFREDESEPDEPELDLTENVIDAAEELLDSQEQGLNEENDPGEDEAADIEDSLLEADEACPHRPPEILNLTEANEDDLRRCVEDQDSYIDYLKARLDHVTKKKNAVNWERLSQDPHKITNQLECTAAKIRQSRDFAEFEFALQKTRLKRQERELKELSQELEREMETIDQSGQVATDAETPGGQRWLRMLGVGKKSSD